MESHYKYKVTNDKQWQSIKDLLIKQRKGEFLTPEEKKILTNYANDRRKENLKKKK